jgi:ADP-ribose pyrophosphatase YjhB (NUDIX family)
LDISTTNTEKSFLNNISIDCVIFGFHEGELKVLSLYYDSLKLHSLPGGFIDITESLEEAANIVLKERTGLDDIFLKQFHVFSDFERSKENPLVEKIIKSNSSFKLNFFNQRFITVGFYALVEYTKVNPMPDYLSDSCKWLSLNDDSHFILDHSKIISKALQSLREQLNRQANWIQSSA